MTAICTAIGNFTAGAENLTLAQVRRLRKSGKKFVNLKSRMKELCTACWILHAGLAQAFRDRLSLIKHKLAPFTKSSKGRVEGANAFKQRLVGNEMKDGTFKPAIYFFKTCFHCIRTIPTLSHDKHDPEKYNTTGEDHLADCCIYAAMSRPFVPMKMQKRDKWDDRWKPKEKKRSVWTYCFYFEGGDER